MACMQVLHLDIQSKFDSLHKIIEKQLDFFQASEVKSMHHLHEHFKSVRDCCNTVRPCIKKKLNELSDKSQVCIYSSIFVIHMHMYTLTIMIE